ncbi:MAG: DUF4199 domain-containing protein [Flavobacteriales bacterium]|nr:DUF4199 domain-containing protein [Flavobacteriales bacterium]
MKKTVLKFGGLSALLITLFISISLFLLTDLSFGMQEVVGYLSILIAVSFAFFGIKSHRDKELNGKISFGRALGLGMLISLIPAVAFGAFDVLYIVYFNPEFVDVYYAQEIANLKNELSGTELESKIAEMEDMKELASSPLFNFVLMTLTVLIMGFIVSLISAVTLKRS